MIGIFAAVALSFVAPPSASPPLGAADFAMPANCSWQAGSPGQPATLYCRNVNGDMAETGLAGLDQNAWSAAQSGDPSSMTLVGRFLLYGPASARDSWRGRRLLEAAAAKGETQAMYELATLYSGGYETAPDISRAMRWYRAAANKGYVMAMVYVGIAYDNATATAQNHSEALNFLNVAAASGNPQAMKMLGDFYHFGWGVPADTGVAVRWIQKAADAGDPGAMGELSYLYTNGAGVGKDAEQADRWDKLRISTAQVVKKVQDDEFFYFSPVRAALDKVYGRARYTCRVMDDRSLEDCRLLSEDPVGYGFGDAGLFLMSKLRSTPAMPTGAYITVPVVFTIPEVEPENAATADECAAESIALGSSRAISIKSRWWSSYWIALSKRDSDPANKTDVEARLAPAIAAATERLANGGDAGLFGRLRRCDLN